ncbi:hypothetical protein I7I53_05665 [Histoplasma capsulatum var. duboisii H88]|uniref:Uncharacterized protein n=1 Tax=Ajellomyces capsulatus (strain H88) TaxID=544711 RepID=A0A8A1LXF9_AJEC8|nr:hypothetical protein I7I53_05665 [Histoplasma capsulatum var. duboisii H88]
MALAAFVSLEGFVRVGAGTDFSFFLFLQGLLAFRHSCVVVGDPLMQRSMIRCMQALRDGAGGLDEFIAITS